MLKNKLLLLRAGNQKEYAYRTLLKKGIELLMIERAYKREIAFADHAYIIDTIWDPQKMYDMAVDIYKKHKFDGITTYSDSTAITLGMLSDHFGFDYFSEDTARKIANKLEARKHMRKHGVDSTPFYEIHSYEELVKASEALKYPFVLKPSDRTASKGVAVISDPGELEESYRESLKISKNKILIAERYIDGNEYCVEILVYNHEVYIASITRKFIHKGKHCIKLAAVTPAPISASLNKKVEEYLKEAVKAFEVANSLLHIEIRIDDKENISIIEINPRAAGGGMIENVCLLKGLNLYEYGCDIALKKEIDTDRLTELINRPFIGYALYNPFIYPEKSGVIKQIRGIDMISKEFVNEHEKIILNYKVGEFMPVPKSNEDVRGFLYLNDSDYNRLFERASKIISMLEYRFEE